MTNLTATIRANHSATLNNAARQEVNRRSQLAREARENDRKARENVATIGSTFNVVNLSSEQLKLIEFYQNWLSDYVQNGSNTLESGHIGEDGKFLKFDPVNRELRYARSFENSKNRNNLFDVVNTCFLVFLESVQCGSDEHGNLVRKTEVHKNAAFDRSSVLCDDGKERNIVSYGGMVTTFRTYETVEGLFTGCLRWSVKNVLRQNSGSVDTRSDASKGYQQAYGTIELEQAMDATGILNDSDKGIRNDLATGWNVAEIASKRNLSQKQVRTRIGKLRNAATIASKK